jgi:hypothetical protein
MSTLARRLSLSPVEIDLLVAALEVWHHELAPATSSYMTREQRAAGQFTQRRIDEMLARLKDQPTKATT